ncbi:MAG TPA: cell division protein FtsA [Candidatus Limnocylindrales bacterium]|nr:cell division protein FtsA [Candidatus Limnocylindrales bacterium]
MDREAVLVALDVGTSKVVALIGEVTREEGVTVIGKGQMDSSGLKKGVVVNIEQTVGSIRGAREAAERLSGYRIESAIVAVGGNHLESQNSRGAVAVSGARREVSREDVDRATEVARAVSIPSNREVLHVLPRGFVVDGQEGVKDPLGMSAIRLEVETHIVHASATAVQNLTKCVQRADIRIDELVCASLAAGDAVLTDTERELGVAVADFGAGTIDLALYMDGSPFHTAVLPLGGNNVTNDIAIGLKTSLIAAEDLKIRFGTADLGAVEKDEEVEVAGIGEGDATTASRYELAEIIEARMREVFEKIGAEIERAGFSGMLPAGVVMTGGASQLTGAARLGREVLQAPVRVAGPTGVAGLTDHLLTPAFSTSLGLLMWGGRGVQGYASAQYETEASAGMMGRMRDWARGLFP